MPPVYSLPVVNARLQAVANNIDANGNGFLVLLQNSTVICSIQLAVPCGVVNNGVLTFSGTLLGVASATGNVNSGKITDAIGNTIASGLTVGIPLATTDITLSNGLNSTAITAGQSVQVLAAQITGS